MSLIHDTGETKASPSRTLVLPAKNSRFITEGTVDPQNVVEF